MSRATSIGLLVRDGSKDWCHSSRAAQERLLAKAVDEAARAERFRSRVFFFFSSRRRHTRLQGDEFRRVLFRSRSRQSELRGIARESTSRPLRGFSCRLAFSVLPFVLH